MHFTSDHNSITPSCAGQVTPRPKCYKLTLLVFSREAVSSGFLGCPQALALSSSLHSLGPMRLPAECCRFSSSCALVEATRDSSISGGSRHVPEAEQTSQLCLFKEL